MAFWSRFRQGANEAVNQAGSDDDASLAGRLRSDPEALSLLYERYVEQVYRYCYVRLGSRERAEDATSEVFLRVVGGLEGYQQGKFAAWLFRIAYNVVVDSYRAERPEISIEEAIYLPDPHPGPEQIIVGNSEDAPLEDALATLNQEQRAVIEMQFTGWSDAQIAAALSRTPAAVRMLRLRTMQRLREIMRPSRASQEVSNER